MNDIANVNDIRKNDDIFKKKLYMKSKNVETVLFASVTTLAFNIENYAQINIASFIKRTTSQFTREILSQDKSKIEKKSLHRNMTQHSIIQKLKLNSLISDRKY